MAFDPAQSLNNYNVYKSGQNGADNRTNQNNQPAGMSQLSGQNTPPPKAIACNNADGSKPSASPLKKMRQINIKITHSQKDINKLFIEAVKTGDVKRAKTWLDAGADVNKGYPLSEAAENGHIEIVKLLLSHPNSCDKIDLDEGNEGGPLFCAAVLGHIEIVKLLLSHPNIDVNKADWRGRTPLFWAAENGRVNVVNALLSHPNIDVNKANGLDQTPLSIAAREGHIEIVKLLLSHPNIDVNQANDYGRTPLSIAAENGRIDVVELLLSHPNSCDKIDVNKADNEGRTPLYWAAYRRGHVGVINALLSHPNIDVNKADRDDRTPLYWAARKGRVDVVKLLLSHPKINMDEDARRYLDRLVDNNDAYSIQEIVLNGCSKEVYEHLYTKAIEADRPQLIERLSHLFTGYANTQALGGHNKAYSGSGNVP
ncbi:MAG: ankyrin repeat domain-containing protein, partial [Desulfobacteraceae bacterium]|nr:ankyrin repeat domain-containing protein [Desulfobacteraceae bacterium]